MLPPLFSGYLILSRSISGTRKDAVLAMEQRIEDAQSGQLPYMILPVTLLVLVLVLALVIALSAAKLRAVSRREAAEERRQI